MEQKVRNVKRKFSVMKDALLQNDGVRALLDKLDSAIKASRRCMVELGVVEICRECAMEGNCCCRKWVENEYGEEILLVNLLLGVELPSRRAIPDACFFLTSTGCMLKAREVICVDFLCDRIKRIGHENIVKLQNIEGEELETLFLLEEKIRAIMRSVETQK